MSAGGRGGGEAGIETLLDAADAAAEGEWDALFISECDRSLRHFSNSTWKSREGHVIYRHWAGAGSVPMAWVVNGRLAHIIRQVRWESRCGSLLLGGRGGDDPMLCAIGIHGNHAEDKSDDLAAVATLWRQRQRPSLCTVIGDFNVDQLPSLSVDPWHAECLRSERHADQRAQLQELCDALGAQIHIAEEVRAPSGGPFALLSLQAPLTRIPQGRGAEREVPSCLDYAIAPADVCRTWATWTRAPSDHSWIMAELEVRTRSEHKKPMRRWRPANWHVAETVMAIRMQECEAPNATWQDITDTLRQVQEETQDRRSARERRRARVPTQARDLYKRAAESTDHEEWTALRSAAWQCIRRAHAERLNAEHMQHLRSGGIVKKAAAVKEIKSMLLPATLEDGNTAETYEEVNDTVWADRIEKNTDRLGSASTQKNPRRSRWPWRHGGTSP